MSLLRLLETCASCQDHWSCRKRGAWEASFVTPLLQVCLVSMKRQSFRRPAAGGYESTPIHPKLVMPLQFVKGRALKYCIGLGKERVKSLRVIKKMLIINLI